MKLKRSLLAFAVTAGLAASAWAASDPSIKVSGRSIEIKNGYTQEMAAQFKEAAGSIGAGKVTLKLKDVNSEDLAKIMGDFTSYERIYIDSKTLTSIEPLKNVEISNAVSVDADAVSNYDMLAKFKDLDSIHIKSKGLTTLKWMNPMIHLQNVDITADSLKSIDGLPDAPKVHMASINNADIPDLTPANKFSTAKVLNFRYANIKDFTPLAANKLTEELSLYGATVSDFTPLAAMPALKKVDVYASKGGNYQTLGALTQVTTIHTGMTAMDSIEWVKKTPNLKELRLFSEKIADYTPVNGSGIENLTIWSMRLPVDLSQIKGASKLKVLTLWSCTKDNPVTNTAAIAELTSLEKMEVLGLNTCNSNLDGKFAAGLKNLKQLSIDKVPEITSPESLGSLESLEKLKIARVSKSVDLAFLAKLKKLTSLELTEVEVTNFDASSLTALTSVDISKATGITTLKSLKALPALKTLTVKKGAFSAEELSGFANEKIRINER